MLRTWSLQGLSSNIHRLENFDKTPREVENKEQTKPPERNQIISEGANRSKETREFRKRQENVKTGSKPLERN